MVCLHLFDGKYRSQIHVTDAPNASCSFSLEPPLQRCIEYGASIFDFYSFQLISFFLQKASDMPRQLDAHQASPSVALQFYTIPNAPQRPARVILTRSGDAAFIKMDASKSKKPRPMTGRGF
jgi:hypothetical protein